MSVLRRVNRGETTIDFVGKRKRWFTISAVALLISLAALGVRQLNLGLRRRAGAADAQPCRSTKT